MDPADEAKEGAMNNDIIDTTTTKTSKRSVSSATARAATVGMAGLLLLGGAALGAPAMAAGNAPTGDASAAVAGSQQGKRQVTLKAPSSATTGTKVKLQGKVKKNRHHKTRVVIQEKHGKKWQKLDSTKTNKKGKFKTSDVLKGQQKVTLRAKAKGHGTSATKTVKLTKATDGNNTPATPATPAQPPAPQPPAPQPPVVVKQNQSITWGSELDGEVAQGQPVALDATASSGLPVTYTVNAPSKIEGGKVTFNEDGQVTVTAYQGGNDSWNAAPNSTKRVTVIKFAGDDARCLVTNGGQGGLQG